MLPDHLPLLLVMFVMCAVGWKKLFGTPVECVWWDPIQPKVQLEQRRPRQDSRGLRRVHMAEREGFEPS